VQASEPTTCNLARSEPHHPVDSHHCSAATVAIADTGSTAHFFTIDSPLNNKRATKDPIAIRNPNGSIMYSTHEAELDIPALPEAARHVHVVPALASQSLLSMGQLCDAGCRVTFDATTATVTQGKTVSLTGRRTPKTRLWHMNVMKGETTTSSNPPPREVSLAAVGSATPEQIVAFAHACLFSPVLSTLEAALTKGYLTNFPGLTVTSLHKHPP